MEGETVAAPEKPQSASNQKPGIFIDNSTLHIIFGAIILALALFIVLLLVINSRSGSPSSTLISQTSGLQQVIAEDQQSVVYITNLITLPNGTRIQTVGSGVIYAAHNNTVYVVTNRHVVDCVFAGACLSGSNQTISIETYEGDIYQPNFINYSGQYVDLASLKFYDNNSDYSVANIDYNYFPEKGTPIVVIGQPLALFEAASQGIISDVQEDQTETGFYYDIYTTDAEINHGNSGGGVFLTDAPLQLIGIPTEIFYTDEPGGSGVGEITPLDEETFNQSGFYYCTNQSAYLYGENCFTCPRGNYMEPNGTEGVECVNLANLTDVIVPYADLSYENSDTGFASGNGSPTQLPGFTVNTNSTYKVYLTFTTNATSGNQSVDDFQSETPGFAVVNVTPKMPYVMPASTTVNFTLTLQVPDSPYYGPLDINEYYHYT